MALSGAAIGSVLGLGVQVRCLQMGVLQSSHKPPMPHAPLCAHRAPCTGIQHATSLPSTFIAPTKSISVCSCTPMLCASCR